MMHSYVCVVNVMAVTLVYAVCMCLSFRMQLGMTSATQVGYHFEEAGWTRPGTTLVKWLRAPFYFVAQLTWPSNRGLMSKLSFSQPVEGADVVRWCKGDGRIAICTSNVIYVLVSPLASCARRCGSSRLCCSACDSVGISSQPSCA